MSPQKSNPSRKGKKSASLRPVPASRRRQRNIYHPTKRNFPETDADTTYSILTYDPKSCVKTDWDDNGSLKPPPAGKIKWIHLDGLVRETVTTLCQNFDVHPLLKDDILSKGQRAKADDMDQQLFALLPMLSYQENTGIITVGQLSLVIGKTFVLSFQSESDEDPFGSLREKLQHAETPIHQKQTDYLAYTLMDAVVDDYFNVLEAISNKLDQQEDRVVARADRSVLWQLNNLRQEVMVVKRNITPVREVINYFRNSENLLIQASSREYFKDIYDHISLAIEYIENYREWIINLQELYMNQVNMRMNQVMKILTVLTALLAPATVIGSIYGMNFDYIPFAHEPWGFGLAVGCMLLISLVMLYFFKRKGWFDR